MGSTESFIPAREYNAKRERAKEVLLQIISAAGGRLEGSTRLYKTFYFAHLEYMHETGKFLTSHPLVEMPNGPGIDDARALIAELETERKIKKSTQFNGYPEDVYTLLVESPNIGDDRKSHAIESAWSFCKDKSAGELSAITHANSRAWRMAASGSVIALPLDVLTDDEFEQIEQSRDMNREALDEALSDVSSL